MLLWTQLQGSHSFQVQFNSIHTSIALDLALTSRRPRGWCSPRSGTASQQVPSLGQGGPPSIRWGARPWGLLAAKSQFFNGGVPSGWQASTCENARGCQGMPGNAFIWRRGQLFFFHTARAIVYFGPWPVAGCLGLWKERLFTQRRRIVLLFRRLRPPSATPTLVGRPGAVVCCPPPCGVRGKKGPWRRGWDLNLSATSELRKSPPNLLFAQVTSCGDGPRPPAEPHLTTKGICVGHAGNRGCGITRVRYVLEPALAPPTHPLALALRGLLRAVACHILMFRSSCLIMQALRGLRRAHIVRKGAFAEERRVHFL